MNSFNFLVPDYDAYGTSTFIDSLNIKALV